MVSTRVLSLGDYTFYFKNFYIHCYLDSSWKTSIYKENRKTPRTNSLLSGAKESARRYEEVY